VVTGALKLYSYWRSSAAYRVRIALNLKGLPYEIVPVHLVNEGGEQFSAEYTELNPQSLVPTLVDGHRILRQSMAIIEYLEETWPDPSLMPDTARDRVRVRTLSQIIACEIHPLNNLRVLRFLEETWNVPQAERETWVRHWMQEGFKALEATLVDSPATGTFCEGDFPTMADCLLVPQVYNALRFGLDLEPFPTVARINEECLAHPAFDKARPENQPDAPEA
jgi:maleylacetoacetate isomerase